MHQQTYQHGCTTGRHLWMAIALALGLTLGSQAAAAKECHHETPLPTDVRLTAPGTEVPEALARFAGAWTGVWEHSGGLCHTLVVEEVSAYGSARIIYSYGTSVLAAAMDSFLKRQMGAHAQLWDIVVAEVFQPLGIFHAPMMHTQEANGLDLEQTVPSAGAALQRPIVLGSWGPCRPTGQRRSSSNAAIASASDAPGYACSRVTSTSGTVAPTVGLSAGHGR